jgi:hypothetical protein
MYAVIVSHHNEQKTKQIVAFSSPVGDRLRRGFDLALENNVAAQRSPHQIVAYADLRLD